MSAKPVSCFISTCNSERDGHRKIPMYKAPEDAELFQKWQNSIPHWEKKLKHSHRICFLHFKKKDLVIVNLQSRAVPVANSGNHSVPRNRQKLGLREGAVPSVFLMEPDSTTNKRLVELTYPTLRVNASKIPLPSFYWSCHVGPRFVAFTCFSNKPEKLGMAHDKALIFRGNMTPKFAIRGTAVELTLVVLKEGQVSTFQELEQILFKLEAKRICPGSCVLWDGTMNFKYNCPRLMKRSDINKCRRCSRSTSTPGANNSPLKILAETMKNLKRELKKKERKCSACCGAVKGSKASNAAPLLSIKAISTNRVNNSDIVLVKSVPAYVPDHVEVEQPQLPLEVDPVAESVREEPPITSSPPLISLHAESSHPNTGERDIENDTKEEVSCMPTLSEHDLPRSSQMEIDE